MASKEATVYVVDVGESTGRKNNGRDISDLDWSLKYVWDKVAGDVKSLTQVNKYLSRLTDD